MSFNFVAAKRMARQTVHNYLSVPVVLKRGDEGDSTCPCQCDGGVELTARLHNKLVQRGSFGYGTFDGAGTEYMEEVDRIVFNKPQLAERDVELRAGDVIEFVDYELSMSLDSRVPVDGPIEEIWLVTRMRA